MPTVKIAISLDVELFRKTNRAARKQRLSRGRFVARALEAYLRRQEDQQLLKRINAAYGDGGVDKDDERFLEAMRRHQGKLLRNEPW
jgi:metal-responsive CopG/Arc/MetJ family transcriptional regulator